MINLELTKELAVELLMVLYKDQKDVTQDPKCTPAATVRQRELMALIDQKLDALVAKEKADE